MGNGNIDATRFDDSALQQGRTSIGMRKVGEKVDPKHMTPKEYRNFKTDTWDGIEQKSNIQNWSEWQWKKTLSEIKPTRIVDKKKKVLDSRQNSERRKVKKKTKVNQRKEIRRLENKYDAVAYYVMWLILFLTLSTWGVINVIHALKMAAVHG